MYEEGEEILVMGTAIAMAAQIILARKSPLRHRDIGTISIVRGEGEQGAGKQGMSMVDITALRTGVETVGINIEFVENGKSGGSGRNLRS